MKDYTKTDITDEQIISYLKGKMTPQQEEAFMNELQTNVELKQRAIAISRLIKGLKEEGANKDKAIETAFLSSSATDVKQALEAVKFRDRLKNRTYKRTFSILSIAASLIAIIWLGVDYNTYLKTTNLAEEYVDVFASSDIIRGDGYENDAEEKLSNLFENVRLNENLAETLKELNMYWQLSTMEVFNDYTNYSAEIGWNLAVGYLKDNDRENATLQLQEMLKKYPEETAVGSKILELLNRIEHL